MERTRLGFLGKRKTIEPINPSPGVWMIPSFGNTGVVETPDGLVLFDVPLPVRMDRTMSMLRSVSDAPVHSVYLTHGHLDHAAALQSLPDAGRLS